ncbi:MAG: type II toxin-antitoxin system VapC family toxin [Deltaproteobacteria bacterium]|nr:type II toxin-antitoxin system VapC family toxin [Deltaproteobacteria bacterium]
MSRVAEVLVGVRALGLDTAPLIYLIEKHPQFLPTMRLVARSIDEGRPRAATSVVTLTEVLARPMKLGRADLVVAYRGLLEGNPSLQLVPIDGSLAVRAAELRSRHGIRTPDALQIAAALRAGCDAFLTNDTELRRVTELAVFLVSDLVEPSVESETGR